MPRRGPRRSRPLPGRVHRRVVCSRPTRIRGGTRVGRVLVQLGERIVDIVDHVGIVDRLVVEQHVRLVFDRVRLVFDRVRLVLGHSRPPPSASRVLTLLPSSAPDPSPALLAAPGGVSLTSPSSTGRSSTTSREVPRKPGFGSSFANRRPQWGTPASLTARCRRFRGSQCSWPFGSPRGSRRRSGRRGVRGRSGRAQPPPAAGEL